LKSHCVQARLFTAQKKFKKLKKVLDFLFTMYYNKGEHCSTRQRNHEPLVFCSQFLRFMSLAYFGGKRFKSLIANSDPAQSRVHS
jgi:hypothetical protein